MASPVGARPKLASGTMEGMRPAVTLRAFTWGYSGWGNASAHFVRSVDAHEGSRGFAPPGFVDLRIHRSVRAADFQGTRFEAVVGASRYRWMSELGNERIRSRRGSRIQIKRPGAVHQLLQHLLDQERENRRVILFCSCLEPLQADLSSACCHRVEVARLLSVAARHAGMRIHIAEWPGEAPSGIDVAGDAGQLRSLVQGARYIAIGEVGLSLPAHTCLGWGSTVRFVAADQARTITTGPAYVKRGRWVLKSLAEQAWRRYDLRRYPI